MDMRKEIYVVSLNESKKRIKRAIKNGQSIAVPYIKKNNDGTASWGWECHNFNAKQLNEFTKIIKDTQQIYSEIAGRYHA